MHDNMTAAHGRRTSIPVWLQVVQRAMHAACMHTAHCQWGGGGSRLAPWCWLVLLRSRGGHIYGGTASALPSNLTTRVISCQIETGARREQPPSGRGTPISVRPCFRGVNPACIILLIPTTWASLVQFLSEWSRFDNWSKGSKWLNFEYPAKARCCPSRTCGIAIYATCHPQTKKVHQKSKALEHVTGAYSEHAKTKRHTQRRGGGATTQSQKKRKPNIARGTCGLPLVAAGFVYVHISVSDVALGNV